MLVVKFSNRDMNVGVFMKIKLDLQLLRKRGCCLTIVREDRDQFNIIARNRFRLDPCVVGSTILIPEVVIGPNAEREGNKKD